MKPVPCCSENRRSFRIVVPLLRMDGAIDLDTDAPFGAAEVKNEWTHRMLTTELQPIQPSIAQSLPRMASQRPEGMGTRCRAGDRGRSSRRTATRRERAAEQAPGPAR